MIWAATQRYAQTETRILMAKPNYAFEKRQKELAKKKKKEEKRLRKLADDPDQPQNTAAVDGAEDGSSAGNTV